jgi:outer membrane lipoprotein-sorting protein
MKALKTSALLISGLFFAINAFAADLKTVDQVIAKYDQARGLAKLKSVQSMRSTASLKLNGIDMPTTIEVKRPNQARMDSVFQGMTISQVITGNQGWKLMPTMGKADAQPMTQEEASMLADMADFDGPFVNYQAKGHQLALQGVVDIEGTPAYKLRLTRKNGDIEYSYIDTEYFLMIRNERKMKLNGMQIDAVSTNGDFKDVQGMMVPHSASVTMKMPMGEFKQTMTITDIQINVPIDAARFVMPKAAKPTAPTPAAK